MMLGCCPPGICLASCDYPPGIARVGGGIARRETRTGRNRRPGRSPGEWRAGLRHGTWIDSTRWPRSPSAVTQLESGRRAARRALDPGALPSRRSFCPALNDRGARIQAIVGTDPCRAPAPFRSRFWRARRHRVGTGMGPAGTPKRHTVLMTGARRWSSGRRGGAETARPDAPSTPAPRSTQRRAGRLPAIRVFRQVVLSTDFFRVLARNFFRFRHGRAAASIFPTFPA